MRAELKTNRSMHEKGKGDKYWNSVIDVAMKYAKHMVTEEAKRPFLARLFRL